VARERADCLDKRSVRHRPYSVLAPLYDQITAHVDYEMWAEYLFSLMTRYAPSAQRILELGCGTGSLTYRLRDNLPSEILATDASEEMLAIARAKLPATQTDVRFRQMDFRHMALSETFDVVILAHDGINYLLELEEVATLIENVSAGLDADGVFLFDQSTPSNSINNLTYFDDHWETEQAAYSRSSEYDSARRLHLTRFEIRVGRERTEELHCQRAYRLSEMEKTLKLSSLQIEGCFDAFTLEPATDASERIQWVLSKPRPTG
jgi:SAM-dependent methyltransferase